MAFAVADNPEFNSKGVFLAVGSLVFSIVHTIGVQNKKQIQLWAPIFHSFYIPLVLINSPVNNSWWLYNYLRYELKKWRLLSWLYVFVNVAHP